MQWNDQTTTKPKTSFNKPSEVENQSQKHHLWTPPVSLETNRTEKWKIQNGEWGEPR